MEDSSESDNDVPIIKKQRVEEKDTNPDHKWKNWKLKTIIKENHNKVIQYVAFNYSDNRYSNLVATVGGEQVRFTIKQTPNINEGQRLR